MDKEKKERKEKQDFFLEKKENIKIQIDTKNLLNELAQKISKEFWVDINKIKELISSKTGSNLEWLKLSIKQKDNLSNVISWAKEVIEKASKEQIDLLKWKIEKDKYNPENNIYLTNKFIPKKLMDKAMHPQNLWDNLIWASIWLINSTEEIIKVLYNIWTGMLKAPYHIYLIATGKAKYK